MGERLFLGTWILYQWLQFWRCVSFPQQPLTAVNPRGGVESVSPGSLRDRALTVRYYTHLVQVIPGLAHFFSLFQLYFMYLFRFVCWFLCVWVFRLHLCVMCIVCMSGGYSGIRVTHRYEPSCTDCEPNPSPPKEQQWVLHKRGHHSGPFTCTLVVM